MTGETSISIAVLLPERAYGITTQLFQPFSAAPAQRR
ncbi:hypothetical protein BH23ACT10_BH23ACT10_20680 [soil metagenome]